MLLSMRRHSLRLQHQLHRWSISDNGSLLSDSLAPPACMSNSKSCTNSAGESDGSHDSWASSDSTDSVNSGNTGGSSRPFRVVLLGARGVGKSAIASNFAGAADSMNIDEYELDGEGRACAAAFDSKFIETSAVMQHNVWPAFHGIVQQLRLRRDTKENNDRRRHTHSNTRHVSIPKKAKCFLDKMVAKNNANAVSI